MREYKNSISIISFHTIVDVQFGYPKGLIEHGWPSNESDDKSGFVVFDAREPELIDAETEIVRLEGNYFQACWKIPAGLTRFAYEQEEAGTAIPCTRTSENAYPPLFFPYLPAELLTSIGCTTAEEKKKLERQLGDYLPQKVDLFLVDYPDSGAMPERPKSARRQLIHFENTELANQYGQCIRRATAYSYALTTYSVQGKGWERNFDTSAHAFCDFLSGAEASPRLAEHKRAIGKIEKRFQAQIKSEKLSVKFAINKRDSERISLYAMLDYHHRYDVGWTASAGKRKRKKKITFDHLFFRTLLNHVVTEPITPSSFSAAVDIIFEKVCAESSALKLDFSGFDELRRMVVEDIPQKKISLRKSLAERDLPPVVQAALLYFSGNLLNEPDELTGRLEKFSAKPMVCWLAWIYFSANNGVGGKLPNRRRIDPKWSALFEQSLRCLVNDREFEEADGQFKIDVKTKNRDLLFTARVFPFFEYTVLAKNAAGNVVEEILKSLFELSEDSKASLQRVLINNSAELGVPQEWVDNHLVCDLPRKKTSGFYFRFDEERECVQFSAKDFYFRQFEPIWTTRNWEKFLDQIRANDTEVKKFVENNQDRWLEVVERKAS